MEQEITIREAALEDYAAIAEIYNVSIRKGDATMEEEEKSATDIAAWVDKFNDRERLFVLGRPGEVRAWAILKRYSDREGYRFACETAVYVAEAFVRLGYGSSLKKHLIEVCRNLGYHHMVAKIFATNESSIAYNERLGYTIVGRQNEIGFRNGSWQDVVIMQLIL